MQRLVRRRGWQGVLAVLLVVLAPLAVAAAETPPAASSTDIKLDGAIGYSWLHSSNLESSAPIGFFITADGVLSDTIALVGDISFNHGGFTVQGIDGTANVFSVQVGGKYFSKQAQYTPYAQVLFGLAHGSFDIAGTSGSSTDFTFQPGFGVDIDRDQSYALRAGLNFRIVTTSGQADKQVQLIFGILFKSSK